MTIIDLSDGRNKTTDDKKLENEDFGIISRDNPRFFRFGTPAQRESWAENSLIGKESKQKFYHLNTKEMFDKISNLIH